MEEIVLKDKEKEDYVNLVIKCLNCLAGEFKKKNYEEMVKFNQSIINFFELLRYNEEPRSGDFLGIFDSVKIDPYNCGFPNFETRYLLWRLLEKENNVERLHREVAILEEEINRKYMDIFFDETTFDTLPQIPVLDKIVSIREHNEKKLIFTDDEPTWLRRLDFLHKLRNVEIPMNYDHKITYLKAEGKSRYYQIIQKGFDDAKKLWAMYEIVLTTTPAMWKTEPFDRLHRVKPEFEERLKLCFNRDPANAFIMLSGADCIEAKLVKRCEVGPFYYSRTDNQKFVQEIFEDKKFPFLMCYKLEYLSDQDGIAKSLQNSADAADQATNFFASYLIPVVDKLVSSDPSTVNAGAVKSQNYFVCPHEMRNDMLTKVKFYDNFKVFPV